MSQQIVTAVLIHTEPILTDFLARHLLAWIPLVGLIALALGAVTSIVSAALEAWLDGDKDDDDDAIEQQRLNAATAFRRGR